MSPTDKDFFEETHVLLTNYVEDRLLLAKIEATKKTSKLISSSIVFLIVIIFLFFIFLFAGLMGGYFFAEKFGSLYKGFALMGAIYFSVLTLFLLFFRKILINLVSNNIIKVFFEQKEEFEEEEEND
jgi:hypothetical protein